MLRRGGVPLRTVGNAIVGATGSCAESIAKESEASSILNGQGCKRDGGSADRWRDGDSSARSARSVTVNL